jgi:hypothetical protein
LLTGARYLAIGVAERMAACIEDPRAPDQITRTLADIIRFRLLMIAAGYEDGNDADTLRCDPMFKMALRTRIASAAAAQLPITTARARSRPRPRRHPRTAAACQAACGSITR